MGSLTVNSRRIWMSHMCRIQIRGGYEPVGTVSQRPRHIQGRRKIFAGVTVMRKKFVGKK